METLGKTLSLIIITLFGAVTAVVSILDNSQSSNLDSSNEQSSYYAKPDVEVQAYRKQLRNSLTLQVPQTTNSHSKKDSLWSKPYTTDNTVIDSKLRPEIVQISNNNTFKHLNTEMNYWYNQYNALIKNANRKHSAKQAYNKYRLYKEALKIKRAYNR
ncbi:MAG: hypothetical protein GWO07_12465 [Candidatus Dadabacteria bacterium]|nr:hypothetical protein [Candidatus Dadabacteria bacterium]NIS09550.1 hypothetical protein [Candidatus Dadabacteria bacterium]NIV43059.1 hypothetical protein [Candidatus Dadabacteria bacterium]NIX16024.1 hypothetical protein [Candidatus Dadabacteria bacterium]NIY22727.1 hypothetical protein [Candidatus Dadabacteria bacterium]